MAVRNGFNSEMLVQSTCMPQHVTLETLNTCDTAGFVGLLDGIFEEASWVAERAAARRPFATVLALHDGLMAEVLQAPVQDRIAFVAGHPDLAGKAARRRHCSRIDRGAGRPRS